MEVGDALGRVDHGQLGAAFVAGVQVALDLVLRALGQRGDLVVQVDHAVVDVDAQLVEQLAVFLEGFLVEDLHAVAEHDGCETFIIVAFTCSENITPVLCASSISFS